MADEEIRHVPLEDMDLFVNQSREHFDEAELRQLADNLKANGQLQAGVAWLDPGRNRLVLICGERRFRGLKIAGLPTMAVRVIRGILTLGQMLQMNLAENLQRSNLNSIERAKAFRRLMQLEDLTASEVASRMNVGNATVSRDLSLLDLPEILQARVAAGQLPTSVAAHIARVPDDDTRRALADQYGGGTITRDGIAAEVNRLLKPKQKHGKPSRLACKVDGVAISLTAARPFQWDSLMYAITRLHNEAQRLKEENKPVTDLARVLRAP